MSKVPISVCIIAKNEEKYIEECLRKLKPYGFEIVVADTGSTDATKEIASRYADKVVDFTWINDFSAARNFCAKQASNNWILALDCDGLKKEQVGYIGDDLNDYEPMTLAGFIGCPKDACEEILKIANYISTQKGGEGVVRDVICYILKERGQWEDAIKRAYNIGV